MELGLRNKIVIVTGSNGGIGWQIVQSFLAEGAIVVAGIRGDLNKLNAMIEPFAQEWKERIHVRKIDLGDVDSFDGVVKNIFEEFGAIDVLVNCAGSAVEIPFLLMDDLEIEQQINVNFTHQVLFTKYVVKTMISKKSGSIINVSSLLGSRFGRGVSMYAAGKAAIERFTQALAMEVGRKGIRVNAVCPGIIDTKMSMGIQKNLPEELMKISPISRPGNPKDVADAVLFLSSVNVSGYITGTSIRVDGGFGI